MAEDLIRYDVLAQEALRGVIKKVILEAARAGLPGEHHFYIAVDTTHPGVALSPRLKAEYPEEITVVLQHQFWDLEVTDDRFSVGLSFGGVPEKLVVPFAAIKGFFDPSVQFGLQFDVMTDDDEEFDGATLLEDADLADIVEPATSNGKTKPADEVAAEADTAAKDEKPAADASASVVSLDAFRKKN